MIDKLTKYGFIISSFALVILYILFDKRGRDVSKLLSEIQRDKLSSSIRELEERSKISQEDFNNAIIQYEKLKRAHGDLLVKYGLQSIFDYTGPGAS